MLVHIVFIFTYSHSVALSIYFTQFWFQYFTWSNLNLVFNMVLVLVSNHVVSITSHYFTWFNLILLMVFNRGAHGSSYDLVFFSLSIKESHMLQSTQILTAFAMLLITLVKVYPDSKLISHGSEHIIWIHMVLSILTMQISHGLYTSFLWIHMALHI